MQIYKIVAIMQLSAAWSVVEDGKTKTQTHTHSVLY